MGAGANPKTIKVLALLNSGDKTEPTAVDIYRITSPFSHINTNTRDMKCQWMPIADALANTQFVMGQDIIVLPRYIGKVGDMASDLRALTGAQIVFETDDDYSNHYRQISPVSMAEMVKTCDYATVSTQALAKMVKRISTTPCVVLENHIEFEIFSKIARQTEKLYEETTIMLVGTTTHYDDWLPAATAALRIAGRHSDVRLLVGGYQPDYLQEATFIPPVPYVQYPSLMRQADIVLCAVDPDDKFNKSKSGIKALESWSAERAVGKVPGGAAVIATRGSTYGGVVQNNHNGLLVEHTVACWESAIEKLLKNRRLRQKLQREGYKDARKHHDIANGWQQWYRAYQMIMED